MMVTAFVLISVEDRSVHETIKCLLPVKGITEMHIVAGEYDLVAVIRVSDNQELGKIITQHIVTATGVEKTKTLFALESHSTFDLADIFLDA